MAGVIVVEEGVDGVDALGPLLDVDPPCFQPIAAVDLLVGFVLKGAVATQEADIEEVGGLVNALGHVEIFGGDPADVVGLEHFPGGGGMPGAVAEFDGVTQVGG